MYGAGGARTKIVLAFYDRCKTSVILPRGNPFPHAIAVASSNTAISAATAPPIVPGSQALHISEIMADVVPATLPQLIPEANTLALTTNEWNM